MSSRRQWFVLVLSTLLVVIVVALCWLWAKQRAGDNARGAEQGARAEAGVFRPTRGQLASLKISPVTSMTFRSQDTADGRIAINGDKTTPVFSPYSGRVTKVIASPGDNVKTGAPLAAIAASEYAQGQNDLLAATSVLDTARSQLSLAQANEKRKHGLYDARAGSLQDWLQSQTDLVTAESNLRAAETAVGLARNRLRILDQSEAQIGALEAAKTMSPVTFVVAPIGGT